MPRWGTLLALLAVSTGSVLVAAGPPGLAHLGALIWDNIGWLLLGLGVLAFLSSVAPTGGLLGPLILISAGLVVLSWPKPETWTLAGGAMTVGGGFLVVRKAHRRDHDDPIIRRWVAFFCGTVELPEECPDQLFVKVIAGKLVVNLFHREPPQSRIIELLVTSWGGCVNLHVPREWAVVGGRLAAATGVRFYGTLDHRRTIPDRAMAADGPVYAELVGGRQALVIVHVMGVGGRVLLSRQEPCS